MNVLRTAASLDMNMIQPQETVRAKTNGLVTNAKVIHILFLLDYDMITLLILAVKVQWKCM